MSPALQRRVKALEDIEEIKKLTALYCTYCDGQIDGPTHESEKIVPLFVEDGVLDMGEYGSGQGREWIANHFRNSQQRFPFAFHRISNPIIEVNGDTATANWHLLAMLTSTENQALWSAGLLDNDYLRTRDGWKLKRVKFIPIFFTPYDLGWAIARFAGA
jgi:hypothetical protein